jgi:hypothetical protein
VWVWTSSFPPSSEVLVGGKIYDEPCSGLCILTHEFLMTFAIYEHDGNHWIRFRLFGETY